MIIFTKPTAFPRVSAAAIEPYRNRPCPGGRHGPVRLFGPALGLAASLTLAAGAKAFEANDQLGVNVIIAGAAQCLDLEDGGGGDCEGAVVAQPEIGLKPTTRDEIFVKVGFAHGNGLNTISPFSLSTWAADLEDDLENINGRARDNLLTAWYKHTFEFRENATLAATGGIIDATDYLDDNAFANDEFSQFMNEVFVNAPTAGLPSYDYGAVAALDLAALSLRGVVMDVGANDDGNNFTFYGGQVAVSTKTRLGEGTYRVVVTTTDDAFLEPTARRVESLSALTLSIDQQLGEHVGLFVRLGWQDDDALVTHDTLYSGGLEIKGAMWGREKDNIGLAYGRLDGGNGELALSEVFEAYYRLGIGETFALTGDVQYVSDRLKTGAGPKGTIVSLRGTAEF